MTSNYGTFVQRPAGPAGAIESTWWQWRDMDVHVERIGNPDAPVRLVLFHGAGGNAAAMRPFAEHLAALGTYVSVPDLPGYGLTRSPDPAGIRYGHWQQFAQDFVRAESDDRPLVLMGASMGGLLAFEAAAATSLAAALVVTCLLDPRDDRVRARLTWHPVLGKVAGPALRLLAGPLARVRVPIRWLADMRHIGNDPGLVSTVLRDARGGGGSMSLGWMRSFLEWRPDVEPEDFSTGRVLMVHPAEDRWTPPKISEPFFERITAPKQIVMLENAGHFPIEQPGLDQLVAAVGQLVADLR
jgi:alpha-beta hydrolase superfamily lysophospholipase